MAQQTIGYTEYWYAVLGERSAEDVLLDFGLAGTDGLDEWLGNAESEACVQETDRIARRALEAACEEHHAEALAELSAAAEEA